MCARSARRGVLTFRRMVQRSPHTFDRAGGRARCAARQRKSRARGESACEERGAGAREKPALRCPPTLTLTRAAYHLGNRHTPVEVGADELKLEADPVLEDMLKRLGAQVEHATLPFQPEAGAYGGGHRHGHDETFAEDYELAQRVFEDHHGHDHDHDRSDAHHGHAHR